MVRHQTAVVTYGYVDTSAWRMAADHQANGIAQVSLFGKPTLVDVYRHSAGLAAEPQ